MIRRIILFTFPTFAAFYSLLAPATIAFAEDNLQKPIPINVAEAIMEPFWEPTLSSLSKWSVDYGIGKGIELRQTWAAVEFSWDEPPKEGCAFKMSRDFHIDCMGYDRLILAMTAPRGAHVQISATTDAGERQCEYIADQKAAEYELRLDGAMRVESLTIEIRAGNEGASAGWFKWIGLQASELLPRYNAEYDMSGMHWNTQLKDGSYKAEFKPRYGIFMTEDELKDLREQNEKFVKEKGSSQWLQRAAGLREMQPERGAREFAKSGGSKNSPHARTRDAEAPRVGDGVEAAELGLVLRDDGLLRIAARCALSMAASPKWDEGFLDNFPGSSWELRSFRRGYVCNDIARILDLAGEMFTESGRIYLLRRLAEEGIGPTNYITWRYDYIFQGNQMTFFGRGRLAAYLILEKEWPRVRPYTDLAVEDLKTLFNNVVMPDGGFLEPPTYAIGTIRTGCKMFEQYARARHSDIRNVIPKSMTRSGDYAAAIISTLPNADIVPFGDSGDKLDLESLSFLATIAPKSPWSTLLRAQLARKNTDAPPYGLRSKIAKLPKKTPETPAFVLLPETGLASSLRKVEKRPVKIFFRGNHGFEFHSHEHADTGSFVLEFAGEAFAMDPGITDYDDPRHQLMKRADWHNMLVPVIEGETLKPVEQCKQNITPRAKGNRKRFHAVMDPQPMWKTYFNKWIRTIDSPSPERLTICDDYALSRGDTVEFCWQTQLPCYLQDGVATIQGKQGRAELRPDAECAIRLDELPEIGGVHQHRIVFRKNSAMGTLTVSVRLSPTEN